MRVGGWLVVVGVVGGAAWYALRGTSSDGATPTFRTEAVRRQDVRATVTATGPLEAVQTVTVGTQVSGRIASLEADFNQQVVAGQVLATIDPSVLRANVESARAALAVAEAEKSRTDEIFARIDRLATVGAATAEELGAARADRDVAAARVQSARVALGRARVDLDYATITSPIDGTVLRRDVEVGQTVNAGMSAPTLFLLAGDLSRLRVLAAVDEADIGRVAVGQPVEFTVRSHPNDTFRGRVDQVRLQSTTTENVVTYTVVVGVDNPDGKLLPGLTATLDFVVAEAPGVLCVAPAALRFTPEEAWMSPTARAAMAEEKAKAPPPSERGPRSRRGGRRGPAGPQRVWVEAEDGLEPRVVTAGLASASCTEISGEGIEEGAKAVVGVERSDAAGGGGSSPLGGAPAASRRPGGI